MMRRLVALARLLPLRDRDRLFIGESIEEDTGASRCMKIMAEAVERAVLSEHDGFDMLGC